MPAPCRIRAGSSKLASPSPSYPYSRLSETVISVLFLPHYLNRPSAPLWTHTPLLPPLAPSHAVCASPACSLTHTRLRASSLARSTARSRARVHLQHPLLQRQPQPILPRQQPRRPPRHVPGPPPLPQPERHLRHVPARPVLSPSRPRRSRARQEGRGKNKAARVRRGSGPALGRAFLFASVPPGWAAAGWAAAGWAAAGWVAQDLRRPRREGRRFHAPTRSFADARRRGLRHEGAPQGSKGRRKLPPCGAKQREATGQRPKTGGRQAGGGGGEGDMGLRGRRREGGKRAARGRREGGKRAAVRGF